MPWTTPRTWVVGEQLTAALMNTHVRDNENEVVRRYNQGDSAVSISNTSTETTLFTFTMTSGDLPTNGILSIGAAFSFGGGGQGGTSGAFTWRLKVGGANICVFQTEHNVSGDGEIQAQLYNSGATAKGFMGWSGVNDAATTKDYGSITADLASTPAIALTGQYSVAAPANAMTFQFYHAELRR